MASFVIHHIAGISLLDTLEKKYGIKLTEVQKKQFLLGNLIVDSVKTKMNVPSDLNEIDAKKIRKELTKIIQKEKNATHFRDDIERDLIIQSPKLDDFINKYYELLNSDLTVLGYFYHLYTDKMFFVDLFNNTFECLDKERKNTIYIKEAEYVKIKKNNEICKATDFFDYKYFGSIYNDYTKINKILLEYYNIDFNSEELLSEVDSFINPGIEEVDYSNIVDIINKTNVFINDSYACSDNNLNVFDEVMIKDFIDVVANSFIEEYDYLVNKTGYKLLKKLGV